MTNDETISRAPRLLSINSTFGIRHSTFRARGAFTIIELLVVISIIIILAGLVLGTVGYVQRKAARARAEAEIMAISAALENYKADNGTYPRDTTASATTDNLDAKTSFNPTTAYWAASLFLYGELSGDRDFNGVIDPGAKSYMTFVTGSLGRATMSSPPGAGNKVTYLRDPFGNSYGYSTAYQKDLDAGTNPPTHGYNPTFDLWSAAGTIVTQASDEAQWVKNW
jgi:type II secretory pathway pseudopilin PulG